MIRSVISCFNFREASHLQIVRFYCESTYICLVYSSEAPKVELGTCVHGSLL